MENLYNELDEARAEVEKLKSECRSKAELSENLKRAYSEQLSRFQEARLQIEKQTQELNEKAGEAIEAKQTCEDLKCSLREKEAVIKHLSTANNKLRNDCDNMSRTWDDKERGLAVALEEANEQIADQEQKISSLKREVEGLKDILSDSKKKYLEVETKAKEASELRDRDGILFNLEEENRKLEDQLKWKKEQFKHLEEAHEKLRGQFKASKQEWEVEKGALLDEMYSLQSHLDSQTRITEDLQNRLQMCNHALAHEENRRKLLEIQVSEFRSRYENVAAEYDTAKSQVECLTSQRNNEIASLRDSLGRKDSLYKEMEYRAGKLELENQELLVSIKELQEAGIQKRAGSSSSMANLKNKLRSLEQTHKNCTVTLKAKETEWNSRLEEMTEVVSNYRSDSEKKDRELEKLKVELENCYSTMIQLRLQSEENSVMLVVLRLAISEAKLEAEKNEAKTSQWSKESKDVISELTMRLDLKNSALVKAEIGLKEECKETESLLKKLDSLNLIEEERLLMQKEVERYNELLEESTNYELYLKDKMLNIEIESEKKIRKISDALNRANSELAGAVCEGNEIMFELWTWKSIAEQLKDELEENHEMRKDLETSLLEQVKVGETIKQEKDLLLNSLEYKDRIIQELQKQIKLLEQELKEKKANPSFVKTNAVILENLQISVECFELESLRREFEGAVISQIAAENTFELEKEKLVQLVNNREKRIDELLQLQESMESKFNKSLIFFSSQVTETQAELDLVHEAWEKIAAAEIMSKLEIEEKKLMIVELEENLCDIKQYLEVQEKSLCDSKQKAMDVEAKLIAKQYEMKELATQMELKLKTSDALVDELKNEKRVLLEDVENLLTDEEKLVSFITEVDEKLAEFSGEDMQLMEGLGKIMHSFNNGVCSGSVSKQDDRLVESVKENASTHPIETKKPGSAAEERSPLTELNYSSY